MGASGMADRPRRPASAPGRFLAHITMLEVDEQGNSTVWGRARY